MIIKITNTYRRLIVVIGLILICSTVYYLLLPAKIPIKHELITDKNLMLGESNHEINDRYELIYDSEFVTNSQIINDKNLKYYELNYNFKII
jgi:hypothetical protein